MLTLIKSLFLNFRFADLLDIIVISFILYFVITWIRRRASRSAVFAIITVIALYTVAHLFRMYLTSMLFQAGLTAALVALVLIFQEDIRKAIEQLSTWGALRSRHALVASSKTIECFLESFTNLANDKIGALVVIKGRDSLDRHLSGGISLNGRLSTPLLYSIFHPSTPLHDGAVIIEGDRIEKFGVRLPLSHNILEVGEAGTRHTAGLGMSERSDSLVIIVSEERGIISIAEDGHLEKVGPELLRIRLENFYKRMFPTMTDKSTFKWLTNNIVTKFASIFFAILLWVIFAFRVENVNRTFIVPVEYRNIPQNWQIENPRPTQVQISLSGTERAFKIDPKSLVASLDMGEIKEGTQSLTLDEDNLNLPSGLKVNQILPRTVNVSAQQFVLIDLPVKVRTSGAPSEGYKITEIKAQPDQIKTLVSSRKKGRLSEIYTEYVEVNHINATLNTKLHLVLPSDVHLVNENDATVRVTISVKSIK